MSAIAKLEEQRVEQARGSWWNLQGILFQPALTFQSINNSSFLVVPFVAATLVKLARLFIFYRPSTEPTKVLLSYIFEALPFALTLLICSAAFFLVVSVKGAQTSFKKVSSVLAHVLYLNALLNVVLGTIIFLASSDPGTIDRQNPIMSNLGFLVDKQEHLVLQHFLASIDLITFYILYLIALGLSTVSRKLSLKSALWSVFTVWAFYVAITVAIKAIVA